jgi:hypothetical protein
VAITPPANPSKAHRAPAPSQGFLHRYAPHIPIPIEKIDAAIIAHNQGGEIMGKPFLLIPEAGDWFYLLYMAGFLPRSVLGETRSSVRLVVGRGELSPKSRHPSFMPEPY